MPIFSKPAPNELGITTGWSEILYLALLRWETGAGRAGAIALGGMGDGATASGSGACSGIGSGAGGGGVGSRAGAGGSGSGLLGSAAGQTSAAVLRGGSTSHVGSLCVVGSSQPASTAGSCTGAGGGATAAEAGGAGGGGAGFS